MLTRRKQNKRPWAALPLARPAREWLFRLIPFLVLLAVLSAVALAQTPVVIGKGCTTAFFIDQDCDGHGVAMRRDKNYGLGNVPGGQPNLSGLAGDLPDADDNDPDVNTVASWHIKYGRGATDTSIAALRKFLLASRGYNPARIAFVDGINGNDAHGVWWSAAHPNNDPYAHPFQHASALVATLADNKGGAVIFRAGNYPGAGYLPASYSLSASSPLIYMSYPGELVNFTGASDVLSINYIFASPDRGYITLDGLQFLPAPATDGGRTLVGTAAVGITIRNCEFPEHAMSMMFGDHIRDLLIENNVFHDVQEHAIYIGYTTLQGKLDQDFDFAANDASYSNPGDKSCVSQDTTTAHWTVPARCTGYNDRITIRDNIFYSVGGLGWDAVHINAYVRNVHVVGNIFHNNGGTPIGFQTGAYDSDITNNLIFANGRYGIIINLYAGGCSLTGYPHDLTDLCHRQPSNFRRINIVNNTLWMGDPAGPKIRGDTPMGGVFVAGPEDVPPGHHWAKDFNIENNVIMSVNNNPGGSPFYFGQDVYPNTFTIRNNIFYNLSSGRGRSSSDPIIRLAPKYPSCQNLPAPGSCAAGNSDAGQPLTLAQFPSYNSAWTGNLSADPKVVAYPGNLGPNHPEQFDLSLQAASPAINAAFAAAAPAADLKGFSRAPQPDIGALEYRAPVCAIGPTTLPDYTPGQVVHQALTATSACAAGKSWSATGLTGSGLTLDAATGILTGTAVAGSYKVIITYDTASKPVTIAVKPAPRITPESLPPVARPAPAAAGSTGTVPKTLTLGPTPGTNTVAAASGTRTDNPVTSSTTAHSTAAGAGVSWAQPPATPGGPNGNGWLTLPYDPVSHQMIFYGIPSNSTSAYSSDIFFYNSRTGTWTHLGGTGATANACTADSPTQPGERNPAGQMAVDTKRNLLWIYGGGNPSCKGPIPDTNPRRDTYYLTLNPNPLSDRWHQVSTAHFPAAAMSSTMIYDPDDDVLFAYGYDLSAATRDQWIYCRTAENPTPGTPTAKQRAAGCLNGDDWNEINHGTAPPQATSLVGMVYDQVNRKALLWGGVAGSTYRNETWAYDLPTHTWTRKCQKSCMAPPAASDAVPIPAMIYNPNTNKVLLHQTSGAGAPADWQYDAATDIWTKLTSSGSVPARNIALGYDPVQNTLIAWLQGWGAQMWIGR